jgi:hypothetical protein
MSKNFENIDKFQIYFKPNEDASEPEGVISFTFSISRISLKDDTYKLKIINEIKEDFKQKTFKIKEFHFNASEIIAKIRTIDFEKEYDPQNPSKDVYFIKFGNKKICTSNKEQIQYILDLFQFDDLYGLNVLQYEDIKDVYEFVKLNKLFKTKVLCLDNDKYYKVYDYYLHKNPYKVFENLNNLENFAF